MSGQSFYISEGCGSVVGQALSLGHWSLDIYKLASHLSGMRVSRQVDAIEISHNAVWARFRPKGRRRHR